MQPSKVRPAQTHHLVWLLTLMALLAVLCLSGCGGGSEDEAASSAPRPPGLDPRLLVQSGPTPGTGGTAGPADAGRQR